MDNVTDHLNFFTLLLFLSVFVFCLFYLKQGVKNLPPGPPCLPLLGSVGFMRRLGQRRLPDVLLDESKTYGPVFKIRVFNRMTVCLIGYDAIHQAFVKQGDVFSDRPHHILGKNSTVIKDGRGIIWQSGTQWKTMRRFTMQALRDFGVGKTSLEEKICQEIDAISDALTASKGEPVNIRPLVFRAIINIIYGINFGSRFDFEDPEFASIVKQLDFLFAGQATRITSLVSFLPDFIADRIPTEYAQQLKKRRQVIDWVRQHIFAQIRKHQESFNPDNIRDFVDLYIQTVRIDKKEAKDGFTDGNLFRVMMDLFIAGSETSSNTMNWSVLYMIENPGVQEKCQRQLQEVIGDRQVTWLDRRMVPYVEATLMEIQRLANIAPVSLAHTTNIDTTLMDYMIPKGTILIAILTSSNMDPKYWQEPEKFNPERFLTDDGKLKRVDAFIPFSTGPRICAGESLARMEMFLIFSNLLQRFTFTKEDQNKILDFTPLSGQFTSAPQPYKARAVARNTEIDSQM